MRWIVEQTFGWLNRNRRLGGDYEQKAQVSETLIEIAMIRLMLAGLRRSTWPCRTCCKRPRQYSM